MLLRIVKTAIPETHGSYQKSQSANSNLDFFYGLTNTGSMGY